MTTFLMVRGLEPVELDDSESFNRVRQRMNQVLTNTNRDGTPRKGKDASRPLHDVTFKTAEGGRFAPNPNLFQGVGSDLPKDGAEEEE